MRTAKFENNWKSVQDIMPINNSLSCPEWDKFNKRFIITTKDYTMNVKEGNTIVFDENDNAICFIDTFDDEKKI